MLKTSISTQGSISSLFSRLNVILRFIATCFFPPLIAFFLYSMHTRQEKTRKESRKLLFIPHELINVENKYFYLCLYKFDI